MKQLCFVLFISLLSSSTTLTGPALCAQSSTKNDSPKNKDAAATKDAEKQETAGSKAEQGERHEFVITNFKTESGVTLPQARVVYGTYGKLNAARDNVVLLPSHYMADFHGYEWLIGPDKALDPSKLFLVATELFGNGHSSSPSNTPEPFTVRASPSPRFVTTWKRCIAC
jgi:hypothetical protein